MSAHRKLDRSPEALARHFISYAEDVRSSSPLYGRLLLAAAEDSDLLILAGEARRDQPAGLLMLASVHYLLLREERSSPLALYYPSVVGTAARTAGDPAPAFRRFCLEHREAISELVSSRRVQTNEVGRSACLLPAFNLAARRAGNRPLALVELGASAGLNLLWDRYAYDYGDGIVRGDVASPVRISCEIRGGRPCRSRSPGSPRAWASTLTLWTCGTTMPSSGRGPVSGPST